jgi:Nucleoporin Nup120/160
LLWRIVRGGTLTIHSVDSVQSRSTGRNRPLTAIEFLCPTRIHLDCVGFAESSEGTVLFIMTEDCVLHTIPLVQNVLSGEERQTDSLSQRINTHRPLFLQARFGQAKLSLDVPHFMHVLDTSDRLIFAMKDGSLHQYNPYGTPAVRTRLTQTTEY